MPSTVRPRPFARMPACVFGKDAGGKLKAFTVSNKITSQAIAFWFLSAFAVELIAIAVVRLAVAS
jgi:hypothetical protein